jgi:hypothetical protein
MLSQAHSSGGAKQGKGTNKDLLLMFEVPVPQDTQKDDWPVVRVRLFDPRPAIATDGENGSPLLFWGDDRESIVPNTTIATPPKLVDQSGQVLWTSDDIPETQERLSVLQIHNPTPGYSTVEIAYVDSKAGLVTPAKQEITVNVSISGAASSQFTVHLGLNSTPCILGSQTCTIRNTKGHVAESLHVAPPA